MNHVVPPHPELAVRYPELFTALREIEAFIEENYSKVSIRVSEAGVSQGTLWFLGARATKLFRSIALLCEQGYGTEAMILVRSLMETYLSIAYIAKDDSELRAKAYGEYEPVIRNGLAKKLNKYSADVQMMMPDNWNERTLELSEQSKAKIQENKYSGSSLGALRWTGMEIQDLAKMMNETEFYIYYHKASEHVHVFPTIADDFQSHTSHNKIKWSSGPSDAAIIESSLMTCTYTLKTLVVLDQKFQFGLRDKLINLDGDIKAKLSKYLATR